eukprot:924711-Karenia_brevis.AAC.1
MSSMPLDFSFPMQEAGPPHPKHIVEPPSSKSLHSQSLVSNNPSKDVARDSITYDASQRRSGDI